MTQFRYCFRIAGSPACAGRSNGRTMWNVYVIKSSVNRSYYIGSTNRLEQRIREHNSGKVRSTKAFRPYVLVKQFKFENEKDARNYEHLLKSKRIEKEAIIRQIERE